MERPVELATGRVRGRRSQGVTVFAGIPYAASPAGSARWRAPRPPAPWKGVRDATEFGPIAPQAPPDPASVMPGDPLRQDEDCLCLNVWTPGGDHARRPVLVWIHGGGFTSGTGASFLCRGEALARSGDVVVVTVNYRLGSLGFLAHPGLSDGGAVGNYGLMDQAMALRWVREHIAGFGGDPSNVTVCGESAGGMSIACLLASPMARGLFQRAIIESGPPYTHTMERAEEMAHALCRRLGLSATSRTALRPALEKLPAAALISVQQEIQAPPQRADELPLPFLPAIDGAALPLEPRRAIEMGVARDVPLVVGTNRDEMAFFGWGDRRLRGIDEGGLIRSLRHAAPGCDPHGAVAAYREIRRRRGEPIDPWSLWVAMETDLVFRRPSVGLASDQRAFQDHTYVYLFAWCTPALHGVLGACHGLEIPFVFGCHDRDPVEGLVGGRLPKAGQLAEAMQGAWLAFARDGVPSHAGIGAWASWDAGTRPTMVFDQGGRLAPNPRGEELDVWEGDVVTTEPLRRQAGA